jgi:hypothetical protein
VYQNIYIPIKCELDSITLARLSKFIKCSYATHYVLNPDIYQLEENTVYISLYFNCINQSMEFYYTNLEKDKLEQGLYYWLTNTFTRRECYRILP